MARSFKRKFTRENEHDTAVALCRLPGFKSLWHPVSSTASPNPSLKTGTRRPPKLRGHISISQLVATMSDTNALNSATDALHASGDGAPSPPRQPADVPSSGDDADTQGAKGSVPDNGSGDAARTLKLLKADVSTDKKSSTSSGDNVSASKAASRSHSPASTDPGSKAHSPLDALVPSLKLPRTLRIQDVNNLLLRRVLTPGQVDPAQFTSPRTPPNWELPAVPNTGTKTYLVGVPATVDDIRGSAYSIDGYGGILALVGFQELSDTDVQELTQILGPGAEVDVLCARHFPLDSLDLSSVMKDIGTQREFASLLTHFPPTALAARVFKTTSYLHAVLGEYRRLRAQVVSGAEQSVLDAANARRETDQLRCEWKLVCDHWYKELATALDKADKVDAQAQEKLQSVKAHYQDEIDSLEAEKTRLKKRLEDAELQNRILKDRLEDQIMDPWKLSDFLQDHAEVTGNWDRLHDLFVHCVNGCSPPDTWDTVINVTAMDKRKVPVPPYKDRSQRGPPVESSPKSTPVILDLTGPGPHRHSDTNPESKSGQAHSQGKASQNSKPPRKTKVHKVQRRPSHPEPGRDNVRRSGEKTTVSKEDAYKALPGPVAWKDTRPDIRQTMLAGVSYKAAMKKLQEDVPLHGLFRRTQLIKMLVSMMYWNRLDATLWARYVPTAYYEMADERLDRFLRRGEAPPFWGELEDHTIAYPDFDVDSTVDSTKHDPDFTLQHQDSTGDDDSEEDSEGDQDSEPKIVDPEPGAKRSHRDLDDEDEDPPAATSKKFRRLSQSSNSGARKTSKTPKTTSSSRRSSRVKSHLARKRYTALSIAELDTIEVPEDGETSWRYNGVLVQYVSGSKTSSGQTPGFPDYEVHKFASELVKLRWDVDAFIALEKTKPWDTMFEDRIKLLFFHRREMLSQGTLRWLDRIVTLMRKHAHGFWDRCHWVTIDTAANDLSLNLHTERVARRNALRRQYAAAIEETREMPDFPKTLLHEPGIWQVPERCCAWIWQDPRVTELGGPECKSLKNQLKEIDSREPARTQWATTHRSKGWLEHVPAALKARMLNSDERARNPIHSKDLMSTRSAIL